CNRFFRSGSSTACSRYAGAHGSNPLVHAHWLASLLILVCASQSANAQSSLNAEYQQALGWIADGRQLLAQRRFAEAQAQFSRYVNSYPADPRGFFWLGVAQDEAGDPAGALKMYSRSLDDAKDLGMDSAELRTNLGNTLLKLNYIKEATYDFKRALEIDPTAIRAHLGLAQTALQTGLMQDALAQLQTCSEQGFTDPVMPFLKAKALLGLRRGNEAREQLQLYEHGMIGASGELISNARALMQQLPPASQQHY
ncbi:MAG TPA: tetratricopeptide repeat protein, partial [Trichormus sp.]